MTQLTLVIGNKNYSSWSLRAWLAMKQAGVTFAEMRIPLDTPTSHQEIRRYSPSGQVPVLLHGDLTVWESLAICEYVAEVFAPGLWPQGRRERAIARSIAHEMHGDFINLRQKMPMDCRARYPGEGMKPELRAEIDRITSILRECRTQFGADGDFLFGKFTVADAMFAPVVSRFITYDVKLGEIETAYAKAIVSLPAMQDWLEAAANEVEHIDTFF